MNKNSTYQLIEDYLNGVLDENEKAIVEQKMEHDIHFKNYMEQHRVVNTIIIQSELNSIRQELKNIHHQATNNTKIWNLRSSLLLFFTTTAFLLITFFLINTSKKKNQTPSFSIKKQEISSLTEPINTKKYIFKKNIITPIENSKPARTFSEPLVNPKHEVATLNDTIKYLIHKNDTIKKDSITQQPLEKNNIITYIPESSSLAYIEVKDECISYHIPIKYEIIQYPCQGKNDGEIKLSIPLIEDASSYRYSIDGGRTIQKNNYFTQLLKGNYNVLVINKQNCKSDPVFININNVKCDFVISPNQQIFWSIPVSRFNNESKITLEIYEARNGKLHYNKILDSYTEKIWKGKSTNGIDLLMGNYVYIMSSNSKRLTGNITIVR